MENKTLSLKNVIVFFVVAGFITLAIFSLDIIMMLFAAFVVTCAISPFINKMEEKIPRIVCVTIVLLGLILISSLILAPLFATIVHEAVSLANNFPYHFDKLNNLFK